MRGSPLSAEAESGNRGTAVDVEAKHCHSTCVEKSCFETVIYHVHACMCFCSLDRTLVNFVSLSQLDWPRPGSPKVQAKAVLAWGRLVLVFYLRS